MLPIEPSFLTWFGRHRADFDALVFDIDGVLMTSGRPIPGSVEVLQRLRAEGVPFSLLTNDGSHSIPQKVAFLERLGFALHPEEITSCSDGLVEIVREQQRAGQLMFILGDLGVPCYAEQAGLRTTRDLRLLPECDGVIVGEAHYDWEPAINGVLNHLLRHPNHPLLVPNPDEYYPGPDGTIIIAAGGVARFIAKTLEVYGIKLEPNYLGKPYQPIFNHQHAELEKRLGRSLPRRRILMLGDSLASDIRGAKEFGYRAGLLLTGITREQHLPSAPVRPDHIFRGF